MHHDCDTSPGAAAAAEIFCQQKKAIKQQLHDLRAQIKATTDADALATLTAQYFPLLDQYCLTYRKRYPKHLYKTPKKKLTYELTRCRL